MTKDALVGNRMIGMVQPRETIADDGQPYLYETGCVGRITACRETEDGRFYLILKGVCRFNIERELPLTETGYRIVLPKFGPYFHDLCPPAPGFLERSLLLNKLRSFAESKHLAVYWEELEKADDEGLISSIAMSAPLDQGDKQALLQAQDPIARATLLLAMLDMESHEGDTTTAWVQ